MAALFVRKGDPPAQYWKQTACFAVEVGLHLPPIKVYRLRAHGTAYPLVRYYAEPELKRLFRKLQGA